MGRIWVQSEGEPKSLFVRQFTGDAFINAAMRETLNGLQTERAKDIQCKKIWEHQISRYFDLDTHTKFENFVLGIEGSKFTRVPASDEQIVQTFGRRIIVVDEAQYNRKEKRLFRALIRVITVCRKSGQPIAGLYLLTGTPMIESAEEICPLLNLMLFAEGYNEDYFVSPQVVKNYIGFFNPPNFFLY